MSRAATARRSARAVVIGPAARRALGTGAAARSTAGSVVWAFGPGGYLRFGERHVLLAPARAPMGPMSILVAGLVRGDLVPGEPAVVSGGVLLVGPLRISLSAAREAPPPQTGALAPAWRAALAAALAVVAPAAPELVPGLAALAAGDRAAAVALLAGRGEGLTPAGDDALAGYAAWRWSCGAPVALATSRCAPLGRAYLRCAERGELPQPAADVLAAIRAADAVAAARRAPGLSEWGASSGAALLWGMAAGAAETSAAATSEAPARANAPGLR